MIKIIQRNIARFLILVLFQVLFLNNYQPTPYFTPYLYVLFILLMPFETPNSFLLISSFVLGISIDMFSDTFGINAAASVFMAYSRPRVLKGLAPREGYELNTFPRIHYYGLGWFIRYAAVLVVLHHFALFTLEAFTFELYGYTILKMIANSAITIFFCVVSQYFIFRK